MKRVLKFLTTLPFIFLLLSCTNKTTIKKTIIIDASLTDVWNYNAKDEHAKDWSIFFAKIVPCPVSECTANKSLAPGDIGAVRRCYRNDNEHGIFWDETTIASKLTHNTAYRKIITSNINGYNLESLRTKAEFIVEQHYTSLNNSKTELSFSVKLQDDRKLRVNNDKDTKNNSNFLDRLIINTSFSIGRKRTLEIFTKNLENIKAAIEQKRNYKRKHPYSKFCDIEKFWCSESLAEY